MSCMIKRYLKFKSFWSSKSHSKLVCINVLPCLSKATSCWQFTISCCTSVDSALEKIYWHKYKQFKSWPHADLSNYNVLPVFTSNYDPKWCFPFQKSINLIWQEFSHPDCILSALGSWKDWSIWGQFSGLSTQRTIDESWKKKFFCFWFCFSHCLSLEF